MGEHSPEPWGVVDTPERCYIHAMKGIEDPEEFMRAIPPFGPD